MIREAQGADRAQYSEYASTIYLINDRLSHVRKELESLIDKRDRSYDNAVTARVKGFDYLYTYWESQYRHYSEKVGKLTEELSKVIEEAKQIEQLMEAAEEIRQ